MINSKQYSKTKGNLRIISNVNIPRDVEDLITNHGFKKKDVIKALIRAPSLIRKTPILNKRRTTEIQVDGITFGLRKEGNDTIKLMYLRKKGAIGEGTGLPPIK